MPTHKTDIAKSISKKRKQFDNTSQTALPETPVIDPIVFKGIAGGFALEATRNSEGDPIGVLITMINRLSAELGHGIYLMVGDSKHFVNFYAVLVGKTAKARKGTSAQPVVRLFENIKLLEKANESPGPLSTGEGLIYHVRDEEMKWDPKEQRHIMVDAGVPDKRLFILTDEFASALEVMKRDGNTLSTVARSFWDHGNAAPLTKTTRTKCTGAHVSILGHITAQELKQKMPGSEFHNGFANRILWVHVERKKEVPRPIGFTKNRIEWWADRITKVIKYSQSLKQMTFTNKALQFWAQQYSQLSREDDSMAGIMTARSEAIALRLSMIFAIMSKSRRIKTIHVKQAIALVEYGRQTAKHLFPVQLSESAQRLKWALEQSEHRKLTRTEVSEKVFHRNLTAYKLDAVINELSQAGLVQTKAKGKGAKRTQLIKLNN